MNDSYESIVTKLTTLGCALSDITPLNNARPDTIDYLDLINIGSSSSLNITPQAVVTAQDTPVLYALDGAPLASVLDIRERDIHNLIHTLACRGENCKLVVIYPGRIDSYDIHVSSTLSIPESIDYQEATERALLSGLLERDQDGSQQRKTAVAKHVKIHDLLFRLLTQGTESLLETTNLQGQYDDVLSLIGRVLFTRFLLDRNILTSDTCTLLSEIDQREDCFGNAHSSSAICVWLDNIFNGDLLPLWNGKYLSRFQEIERQSPEIFGILSDILYRSPEGQRNFDLLWGDLDFSYIPVGLLSEVYEHYAHQFFDEHAINESIHYTPRNIAKFMVDQSVNGLPKSERHRAKILDPAVGAGVFLVLAFRRLVAEEWRHSGKRPNTKKIRSILNNQLCGMDINSSALKFTALSLYLTALELDPKPYPAKKLAFKHLMNNVLHFVRGEDEAFDPNKTGVPILGSLGTHAPSSINGTFDIIIGNPPWTSWKGAKGKLSSIQVSKEIRHIASIRSEELGKELEQFEIPDNNTDYPFFWYAMRWGKPSAIISLACHARILFRQSNKGIQARNNLIRAIQITGVLNGASLRNTDVWETVTAPFCIVFAKNSLPRPEGYRFNYISPCIEKELNGKSRFRIDSANAKLVNSNDVIKNPYLFKILYRGTYLDLDLLDKVFAKNTTTVEHLWNDMNLPEGQGYQVNGDRRDSRHMIGMPNLTRGNKNQKFVVDGKNLDSFNKKSIHRPRDAAIYRAPLCVIPKSINPQRENGKVLVSYEDIVYNESYSGFSGFGHPQGKLVVEYLFVILYSKFSHYFPLLTSGQFGVEREVLYKQDLENLPIVSLEYLSVENKRKIPGLAKRIRAGEQPWEEVDSWIADVYGLNKTDLEVIEDTLAVCSPFSVSIKYAQSAPNEQKRQNFVRKMSKILDPIFQLTDTNLYIEEVRSSIDGWCFIGISTGRKFDNDNIKKDLFLEKLAEESGATKLFIHKEKDRFFVAIIKQNRYWTSSRARQLALEILEKQNNGYLSGKEYE